MDGILITFAISWAMCGAFYLLGGTVDSFAFPLFGSVLMWVPGLVALTLSKKKQRPIPMRGKLGWSTLQAAVWPVAIALLCAFISWPVGTLEGLSAYKDLLPILQDWTEPYYSLTIGLIILVAAWVAGCTLNAIAALGEELMWRGYLFDAWRDLSPRRRDLQTGCIWGLWHAPVILMGHNFPGYPITGVVMMIVACVLLSPILGYLREHSKGVLSPSIFHGTINAVGGLPPLLYADPNVLIIGIFGFTGMAAMLIFTTLSPALRKRLLSPS